MMTNTYVPFVNAYTDCYAPNKPTTGGYVTKRVWNKELKKYQQFKMHRWVYMQNFGPIPEGYEIDHICHNEAVARGECKGGVTCPHRACFNPLHLRAVSKSQNQKAGLAGFGNRTHCKARGHELTQDNIYTYERNGSERYECLACRRENTKLAQRRYRARKQAKIDN